MKNNTTSSLHLFILILFSISLISACTSQEERPGSKNSKRILNPQDSSGDGSDSGNGSDTGSDGGLGDGIDPGSDGDGSSSGDGSSGGGENLSGAPNPSGDPLVVQYAQYTPNGLYLSYPQNGFKKDVDFQCPGDSFLLGEKSEYDTEGSSSDRSYQFHCQFLEDGQGQPLRKANCEYSEELSSDDIDYTCPSGKLLSGQKSFYSSSSNDRSYKYQCCELRNEDDKLASVNVSESETGESIDVCSSEEHRIPTQLRTHPSFTALVNTDVNARLEAVDYSCKNAAILTTGGSLEINLEATVPIENAILRTVKSHLLDDSDDRRHSFYCCQMGFK